MRADGERRTAVIVGATGGIGAACAEALGGDRYELVLAGRRAERLEQLAERVGGRAVVADCAVEEDVRALVDSLSRVDVFVHAAGIMKGTFIGEQDPRVFDEVIAANLRSANLLTAGLLPLIGPGGRLIYISSTAGLKGMPGLSAYSAAKAGLNAFAQAVAGELEREGIGVHLVTPAPVDTPMLDEAAHRMPVLRPEDVGEVVRWLETLPPRVVIREIVMRAVAKGPFASEFRGGGGKESPVRPIGT